MGEGEDALGLAVDTEALDESIVLFSVMMRHLRGVDEIHQPYDDPHPVLHVERERASGCPVVLCLYARH